MERLLLTLDNPADNLALDEALLDWLEHSHLPPLDGEGLRERWISPGATAGRKSAAADLPSSANPSRATGYASALEILRLWESPIPIVVVGRSSKLDEEVDQAACAERGIPILRRPSGGATVLIGPGCLMFALVLSCRQRPELRAVDRAHAFVLGRHVECLRPLFPNIRTAGTSDLVLADDADSGSWKKFSGNSIRLKRNHLLYHGTLLYDFDLSLVSQCLRMPSRQPDYRRGRAHGDFIMNLPTTRPLLEQQLIAAWAANDELATLPSPFGRGPG